MQETDLHKAVILSSEPIPRRRHSDPELVEGKESLYFARSAYKCLRRNTGILNYLAE
jgi:hypothetical protein